MAIENQAQIVETAVKQLNTWEQFIRPRLNQIRKYEDMYALKIKKQLKNRFNIPLPILSGFVDTFKAKIDEFPNMEFQPQEEADLKAAKKVTAFFDYESGADRGQWAFIDRSVKTLAMFSGRGVYKYFAESDPKYKSNLESVDYYDFIFEPQGGADLDKHLFCGNVNIFKTPFELKRGVENGLYDASAVTQIINNSGAADIKKTDELLFEKHNRMEAIGVPPATNEFVGKSIFNLTEQCLTYNGKRYYLFYDHKAKIVLRIDLLKEVFKDDDYPYVSWATHEDPYNFMSKSPCDDVYPLADGMITLFNQGMDNMQKRNWGMRGVDTSVVKNLSQLTYRPDGLVEFDGNKGNIRQSLVELETPENTAQVTNLISFLDNFLGQKTGITAGTQGQTDEDKKVGIFFGELQQVADRIRYVSKMYREAHVKIGKRFVSGLREHMKQPQAIKILGQGGAEWSEIAKDDLKEFDINIKGGQEETQLNEIKSQKQSSSLDRLLLSGAQVNKKWLAEIILRQGEFEEEDIKRAMDLNSDGSDEILSEASGAIQLIIEGKVPDRNRGATTGFVQKIVDYAQDNTFGNLKTEEGRAKDKRIFDALLAYADVHMPVAVQNGIRELQKQQVEQAEQGGVNLPPANNTPLQTEEGIAGRSQELSNNTNGLA